jgi:hypothetical protein
MTSNTSHHFPLTCHCISIFYSEFSTSENRESILAKVRTISRAGAKLYIDKLKGENKIYAHPHIILHYLRLAACIQVFASTIGTLGRVQLRVQ